MSEIDKTSKLNIFDIWSGRPVDGTLNDEFFETEKQKTLETLENLKELVEKGECVGLAAVLGHRNGYNREVTTVSTVFSETALEYSATFIGGLDIIKQEIYEEVVS